jgi:hypothetical protein
MNAEVSGFDPSQFLDATTTEAATKLPPLPVGDYIGTVGEPKIREWESKREDAKVKSGYALDIPVTVDLSEYPELKSLLGSTSQYTLTTGVFFDTVPGTKSLDWGVGKNGQLRRWREALDLNRPGEAFSLRMFQGRRIRIKVKHDPYQGEIYSKIDSVSKA